MLLWRIGEFKIEWGSLADKRLRRESQAKSKGSVLAELLLSGGRSRFDDDTEVATSKLYFTPDLSSYLSCKYKKQHGLFSRSP